VQRNKVILCILFVAACTDSYEINLPRPEKKDQVSSIRRPDGGEIVLAMHFTGGAAGDKTYKVLACPSSGADCEVLATVDSYESRPPEVVAERGGYTLVVNKDDSVWGFMTFSNTFQDLRRGDILLSYR
jgi:hypothetical protein